MTVENEAFIDLETALHVRFNSLWLAMWNDIRNELFTLANKGDWVTARKIANNIDMKPLVDDLRPLAATFSEAALFLGASRIVNPSDTSFLGKPDDLIINNGVEQWAIILERNATLALQTQATNVLSQLEQKFAEDAAKRIVKADPDLGAVGKAGTQFSRATASLMISRMSTAGFMLEATARGVKQYRVNEVMDAATCPICATMHNKTFPVSDGMALSTTIMNTTDPESLKSIAPFPSQSKANIKAVKGMNNSQLIGAGMNLPPYHPYCRGIVTLEVKNRGADLAAGFVASSIAPGRALSVSADLTPDQLAARMFGDFEALDAETLSIALGVGAAAAFGDNE